MVRFEPEIRHTAVRHIATGQPRLWWAGLCSLFGKTYLLADIFTDGPDYQTVLGSIDYAFLFAYAIGMFIRYCLIY